MRQSALFLNMACNYNIGKLKNFVYLVTDLEYKTVDYKVYLVGGTIYKLLCNNVTLTETESYAGRFKFDTSVVCTLNRVYDDTFIKSNQFKLIVENQEGMQFLVSPEFVAAYTSEFIVSDTETIYTLTFSTQSNIPTRILDTRVVESEEVRNAECRYDGYGITKLQYKNSLEDEWQTLDFLTCQYQKTFDGLKNTVQFTITIPVEDNDWHYDLINFPDNLWDLRLESNGDSVDGYKLFPQYTRETSEDEGTPDTFTIVFRGSTSGALVGTTSQLNNYRWVPTTDTICDGFDEYVKEMEEVYIGGEWVKTGQVRKGQLITRNSANCGYEPGIKYRWVNVINEYVCVGVNKYYKQRQQVSRDNGVTWTDTSTTRAGALYEINSEDCGYEFIEWKEDGYICEEYDPTVSWVLLSDEYYCELLA